MENQKMEKCNIKHSWTYNELRDKAVAELRSIIRGLKKTNPEQENLMHVSGTDIVKLSKHNAVNLIMGELSGKNTEPQPVEKPDMDRICNHCGERYGDHMGMGVRCPNDNEKTFKVLDNNDSDVDLADYIEGI